VGGGRSNICGTEGYWGGGVVLAGNWEGLRVDGRSAQDAARVEG
jgi:hypothetical protein